MLWVESVVIRPPLASPSKEQLGQFLLKLLPGGGDWCRWGGHQIYNFLCPYRYRCYFSNLVKIGTSWEDINVRRKTRVANPEQDQVISLTSGTILPKGIFDIYWYMYFGAVF